MEVPFRRSFAKEAIVGIRTLRAECRIVGREYEKVGLMDEKLDEVEIYLVPMGVSYGWAWNQKSGSIELPRLSWSKIAMIFLYDKTATVRNVLRHEMAHGLANTHRGLLRSKKFRSCFLYHYDDDDKQIYDPKLHVSEYASTNVAEDFAEVVRCYVRSRGVIPKRWKDTEIHRKWEFIRELAVAITEGRSRW